MLDSVYTVFKAQVAASELYDLNCNRNIELWPDFMRGTELNDSVIVKQLQFLRVAAVMKLVNSALSTDNDQLGLDVSMIAQIKSQTED